MGNGKDSVKILTGRFAIIPSLASNSPFLMLFGDPGLKKASIAGAVMLLASFGWISCGGYNAGSPASSRSSGLTFRAFVSNPLGPSVFGGGAPVVNIVNATLDQLSLASISLGSSSPPGLMVVYPNKRFTLVFSGTSNASNSLTVIDNAQESVAAPSAGGTGSFTLPDFTESLVVAPDNITGFAAVANAGQPPGAVEVLNLSSQTITASLPVGGAHYVVGSHNGNRVLAFGSSPDTITVISPSLVGTSTDPRTPVMNPSDCSPTPGSAHSCPFDYPVWGIFSSDDSTVYIFNCGAECSGTTASIASIAALDMTTNPPTAKWTLAVPAATFGLLSGNTLYVAGTPLAAPGANTCEGSSTPTLATHCGELSVIDVVSVTVTPSAIITDGYHNRMEMGANQQLFIGARTCTNITPQTPGNTANPPEIRGCLSIFNIAKSQVVIPRQNFDVTGIAPITGRSVVYVCQGGFLKIYDTTNDQPQTTQVSIVGQAVDVKLVD